MNSRQSDSKLTSAAYNPFGFEPEHKPAGVGLWIVAVLSFAAFLGISLIGPIRDGASIASLIWRVIIVLSVPLIVTGLTQTVHSARTERTKVGVFSVVSLVGAAACLVLLLVPRNYLLLPFQPDKSKFTAADFRKRATNCMSNRDTECAQENWADFVRLRPSDGHGIANLGIAMNMNAAHTEAVVQFKKAIELGEGAYDLFAYYAESLEEIGQIDEAIDWNYRALSIYPSLVDVRGRLASLLILRKKHHEALIVLQTFDEEAVARGGQPYFAARRISIETAMAGESTTNEEPVQTLRVPLFNAHYFVPIKLGDAPELLFVVDTGATATTLSSKVLTESKATYRVLDPSVLMVMADGRRVTGQSVSIKSLHVGPFELKDVNAVICENCLSLLGQLTLANFNLQSSRVQGVEFLTLTHRNR